MSFILANIKRVLTEVAQDEPVSLNLKDHNTCSFVLPSKKLVNLTQPYYVESRTRLSLWTDVEDYLLKSQKMLYLKQIEYHLPGILYWARPESALFLAIRHAAMKVSGETNPEVIENVIDQNDGIFEFFKNFFDTVVNVFKFSLQKPSGISEEMEKNILLAMMEWLQYQKVEKVFYPVMHSNLISKLFPVVICPNLDISQTDCFIKDENREINFVNYHFFCFVCQKHFGSSKELEAHLKEHDEYGCTYCGVNYEDYKDLCSHRLVFCRGANDKNCSFCLFPSENCTCAVYFKSTIEQIYKQLNDSRNTGEVSSFITECFTHYKEVMMKPSDVIQVKLCPDNPKLSPKIKDSMWPKTSSVYDEDLMEIEGLNIYGNKVEFPALKQSFSKYFSNYLQFDILKLPLLSYFRDACPVFDCNFVIEREHYFGTHLRCPIASRMASGEIPLLYKPEEFIDHLMTHFEQIWFFKEEKLVCSECHFECVEQGKMTLSVITEHAFQHKNLRYPKCLNSNSQICDEIEFSSLQDYVFHLLSFHFKQDKEFRDSLLLAIHFNVVPKGLGLGLDNISGTPKSKVKTNRNLFEHKMSTVNNDSGVNKQSSAIQSGPSSTFQSKQLGIIVNNKSNQKSTDSKITGLTNNPPPNIGSDDFECHNENHPQPMKFKTQEHKDYHIIKLHKCIAQNCHYSNEFESELLKHYKHFHSKTKNICQLCGMGFNDKQEHYESYHFGCTACKTWFATLTDLKAHETQCVTVASNDPVRRQVNTSFINSTLEKGSLMIDQTNTENDFSTALLGILGSSNLTEEMKQKYEISIKKHSSESVITKSRLRAECFSDFKSQELLFDIPVWNDNVSKDAVSKINTVLGEIKDQDIFKASSKDSQSKAIVNFECLESIQNRIARATTICGLSEAHGKILLQNFLSQPVRDEICGYNKTAELLNLSYRRILESLQFLYINIKLNVLESRIMSYRIQEGESIYQFSNRITRHLSLCSKKLDVSLRTAYLENNLAKLLRSNVPANVLAEINRKESVFSPYTSTEILDIYKSVMSRDDHIDQYQYEVMFTQGEVKLRGIDKFKGKQTGNYMTSSSKNRFAELGLDPNNSPKICFLCLESDHISRNCHNYPDTSLSGVLCRVDNEPHGYHRAEQCKHRQQHSTDDY